MVGGFLFGRGGGGVRLLSIDLSTGTCLKEVTRSFPFPSF